MYPPAWGRIYWAYLHVLVATLPVTIEPEYMKRIHIIIENVLFTLPCPECAAHAVAYHRTHPLPTTDRLAYIEWVNNMHNSVNTRLGYKTFTVDESLTATALMLHGERRHSPVATSPEPTPAISPEPTPTVSPTQRERTRSKREDMPARTSMLQALLTLIVLLVAGCGIWFCRMKSAGRRYESQHSPTHHPNAVNV